MPRLRTLGAPVLLVASTLIACRALVGLEAPDVAERFDAGFDAGVDTGVDTGFDAGFDARPPTCTPELPERPGPDAGGGDAAAAERSSWFVMRSLLLRSGSDDTPGMDLDCQNVTCDDRGQVTSGRPTCKPLDPSMPACDGPGGLENSLLRSFRSLLLGSVELAVGTDQGRNGAVLLLANYSNQANDANLTAGVTLSPGVLTPPTTCDGGAASPVGTYVPCWDGEDKWALSKEVAVAAASGFADVLLLSDAVVDNAYVRDDELVVPSLKVLAFPIAGETLEMRQPILRAKLIRGGNGEILRLEGFGAGVVDPLQMLRSLGGVSLGGQPVCTNESALTQIRQTLCKGLDLTLDPNDRFTDKRCDGISVAFRFVAFPARPVVQIIPPGAGQNPQLCPEGAGAYKDLGELCGDVTR